MQQHGWTWKVLCLMKWARQRKTNTLHYHLCVGSKKWMHMSKQKQTHRYREQTRGLCIEGTVVLENTLESPLDSRRPNQSILKEISLEYSLEGLMLKLKFQYFGHLMRRTDSDVGKRPWCWERLQARGEGDDRGWGGWMVSPTQWTWVWASSRSWWWTGKPGMLQSMRPQRVGHDRVTELNW